MTALTQAQKDAAIKAYEDATEYPYSKDALIAALTAAAQVGVHTKDATKFEKDRAVFEAAQVGEQDNWRTISLEKEREIMRQSDIIAQLRERLANAKAATIERCAQICDEAANDPRATKEYRYFCINMAAAIRRLGHET